MSSTRLYYTNLRSSVQLKPFKPFLIAEAADNDDFMEKLESAVDSLTYGKLTVPFTSFNRQENGSDLTELKKKTHNMCMSENIIFQQNKTNKLKSNIFFALKFDLRFLSVCGYLTIVEKG